MKRIVIFGKSTCPVCKDVLNKFQYFKEKTKFDSEIKYVDLEDLDGMVEGAYHEVSDIPTIVILEGEKEIKRWVKNPPVSEEFLPYLTSVASK